MTEIRSFISSPGDATIRRRRACTILSRPNRDLAGFARRETNLSNRSAIRHVAGFQLAMSSIDP